MFRLFVKMGVVRTPDLNYFPILVIPKVIKSKKLGKPIESLSSLTNEGKDVILSVITDIHLRVMSAGRLIRSHHF
jgi:hypothetical protein